MRAPWGLASALSITGSPDSVTRHLRPDEVDGRGHREGVIPNGWHIFGHDREEQSGRTVSALGFVLKGPRVDRGVTVITSEKGVP